MKEILVAVYKREDTYKGHSKINHYHVPVELWCYHIDRIEEREMGIMINGEPCEDSFDIVEVNYKGEVTYRHHFRDKDEANNAFYNLVTSQRTRFVKTL